MTDNLDPNTDANVQTPDPASNKPKEPTVEELQADLMKQLDSYGIQNQQDLDNMAKASSESGRLANYLGQTRQENEVLRREIQEMKQMLNNQYQQQQQQPATGDTGDGQSIDLEKMIEQKMTNVLHGFVGQMNQQTNAQRAIVSEIQNDPDYKAVAPVLENHLQNPNVQAAINNGQTTLQREYDRVVKAYQREMLRKSQAVLQGLSDQRMAPPHTESHQISQPKTPEQEAKAAKLAKLREKDYVSEDDLRDHIKDLFPDDDPMFRV